MTAPPSETRLLLVRHGATEFTAEDRFAGSSDVALSDAGRAQAAALGKRLEDWPIAASYCSDMRRAIDTATLIVGPHRPPPTPRPALREVSHGHWEGMIHREVEEKFADEYRAWDADPLLAAPAGGGESGLAVLARALPELRQILLDHAGQCVRVVSHKATLRILLASLLGMDLRMYRRRLSQDLCCLNIVRFKGSADPQLVLMNDTSHYGSP